MQNRKQEIENLRASFLRMDFKTLEKLSTLTARDRELIDSLEKVINRGEEAIDQYILPFIKNYYLRDLFKLTEHSPTLKALCCRERYNNMWQTRLNRMNLSVTSQTSVFDNLMGALLYFYYQQYKSASKNMHKEAQKLLSAAVVRGVLLGDEPNMSNATKCKKGRKAELR